MTSSTSDSLGPDAGHAAESVRWQALTENLEVRDRWSAHCRRMQAAAARPPAPAAPTSLRREFLAGHPEYIPGGQPLTAIRPGEEDALTPDGVRAFLAWAVREKGADPALARGVTDQLPALPTRL
jgi:hypothetical protein